MSRPERPEGDARRNAQLGKPPAKTGRHLLLAGLVGLALSTGTPAALAGRACDSKAPAADQVQRSLELAARVAAQLDGSTAQVVVLARVGQDLHEYGQRYSHLGLAYRTPQGWRVVHKLNECGTARAAVYRQGLGEFFLDDLFDFEAGIVLLDPQTQARLLPALQDDRRLGAMHTPDYSMVAYPWAHTYQQSNQWALETMAMVLQPGGFATTRTDAQAWLRSQGYVPTTLHLSAPKRLGARLTAANVAFDDHPFGKRFSDRIETVTVSSVFAWLGRSRLGREVVVVR